MQDVVVAEDRVRGTMKGDGKPHPFVTVRIEDPKLLEDLERAGVKFTGEAPNKWLAEIVGWIIPIIFLVALWSFFFRRMGGAEGGVMSFARSRAKIYADDDVKVRFGDVAGVDEAEDELREIVEFLQNPKKYTTIGGRIPKGVLLVGPPGTGKTLLARAVAGEAKVPFFSLSGSEFVEMFVGVGAARVRDLFAQAEVKAPCIVFIDELDALGKVRIQTPMGSHEEREQTLNQLLAEMDGFDGRKGVIIMGATNRPEVLDPALLRPGRFDRQVLVDKPDVRGPRRDPAHSRQERQAGRGRRSEGHRRAHGWICRSGSRQSRQRGGVARGAQGQDRGRDEGPRRGDRPAHRRPRKEARDERQGTAHRRLPRVRARDRGQRAPGARPGAQDLDRAARLRRARLHDAAAARGSLSVDARGSRQPAIGAAGGRSAEEIAFGRISTGAQNDLQRATDIARSMVTEFGMSELLGAVNYNGNQRPVFLESPFTAERGNYSEETAVKIDMEVKRILEDAHGTARRVLRERRATLDALSERLLEKEVIEAEELKTIMGAVPPKDPDGTVPASIPDPGITTA